MSEDLKPVVPVEEQPVATEPETTPETVETTENAENVENAAAEEPAESAEAPENAAENKERTDFSNLGLKEIVDTFKELIEGENMQQLYKNAEALKAAFYKNLRKEKIASGIEQPAEVQAESAPAEKEAESQAQTEEPAEAPVSYNPFAEIERGFKDLYGQYKTRRAAYVQELEKNKEENYQAKLAVIEDLKNLVEASEDLKETFPKFREIQNRWRAIGPVPQAKMKDLYDTYQHYVEMFYDYVKINKEFRDLDFKKNLESKEKLCEKAEALADEEDVVGAFRTLQKLHEQWKELGPVSKEFRDSIWERFRAATAVINKKHQSFFESQKGSQKENFEAKSALCDKVEEIAKTEVKDSTTWNTLTKEIENIQKEWRKIGFASKKENQRVYDRFRAACDEFFNNRDKHAGSQNSEQNENLAKKRDLIDEIRNFAVDSVDDARAALREFQDRWNAIGFVPFKEKTRIQDAYHKALNEKFAEFREGASRYGGKAERAVRSERDRLVQKFMKKEQEIATWENNMGFFSQSKNAEALLEELNKKIDIAREELARLEEEIKEFDRQHEKE